MLFGVVLRRILRGVGGSYVGEGKEREKDFGAVGT